MEQWRFMIPFSFFPCFPLVNNQPQLSIVLHYSYRKVRTTFFSGRKRTPPDSTFYKYIEPLALDKAEVGFCKALLGRVESLQREHYNNGEHIPFSFTSSRDKNLLYSLMWEYAREE
jgi:hypothetical protein